MKPLRIYIAGPYTADTIGQRNRNIETARYHCALLIKAGHYPFCPHTMSAKFDDDYPEIGYEQYMKMYLHWMRFCDSLYPLDGWQKSSGTKREITLAEKLSLDIYYDPTEVPQVVGHPSMAELLHR